MILSVELSPDYTGLEERFWSKVDLFGPCWLWTSGTNENGYGCYNLSWLNGKPQGKVLAHRYAWESLVGPIPDGLVLDHLCRVPACINPDHLEPVTQAENNRRGYSPSAACARMDECLNGHPLDGLRKDGHRYCKTCNRERVAARRREP